MRISFTGNRRLRIKLSDVMSALSHALDLVEGQPRGHSVRSCLIGMRVAQLLKLPAAQRSSLFYALLMKDLGCSSNAAKMCFLFGSDDRAAKGAVKTVNTRSLPERVRYACSHVAVGKPWFVRLLRICKLAAAGERAGKELIQIRCERGAKIARLIGLGEETALSIHSLDEHFDGGGHPDGLIGEQIPLCARIMGLAQTAEVFHREHGLEAMRTMLRDRRGTWFEPALVDALLSLKDADDLWADLAGDANAQLSKYEPDARTLFADEAQLDNIALGFAQVIDAKSPWTYRHSQGVAEVAVGIAGVLGLPANTLRDLNRAALLHDIGKLGVSNLILDKPGKLTPEEFAEVKKHPGFTFDILRHVAGFDSLAEMAASHHERLDGKGYYRGLTAERLSTEARILCVSDMYEALASKRPYRDDLSAEEVMTILDKNAASGGICPEILAALKKFVAGGTFVPYALAA
jgi:HD-GYP domain-containing protein (c-di-GMP phosphodiesterase class II)